MSGDIMEFPDTVEEFMEEYKMVDKHEVYSNGIEYVPIFRMEQWFEHCTEKEKDITQKDWADYWHKLAQSYAHTIHVMAEAIAQHGIRQWIPCSERLPDDDGSYLCSEWGGFCYTDNFSDGKWRLAKNGAICIAWMPLPKPYEKEGGNT